MDLKKNMQHASDTLPFKKKAIVTLLTHEYFPKEHTIYRYSNIPVSMEFSRQEYWSGLPFPSPGDLSQPRDWTQVSRIAGRFFTIRATQEAPGYQ